MILALEGKITEKAGVTQLSSFEVQESDPRFFSWGFKIMGLPGTLWVSASGETVETSSSTTPFLNLPYQKCPEGMD